MTKGASKLSASINMIDNKKMSFEFGIDTTKKIIVGNNDTLPRQANSFFCHPRKFSHCKAQHKLHSSLKELRKLWEIEYKDIVFFK